MTCTEIKVGGALLHGSPVSEKLDVLERYGEPYVRLGHVDAIAPFFMSIACVSAPLSWLRVAPNPPGPGRSIDPHERHLPGPCAVSREIPFAG